jgi:hypothetical protein
VATVPAAARSSCQEIGAAYDPAKDSWRTVPSLQKVPGCLDPLTTDMAVWTGKELLLWGETDAAFNPVTNRWRRLPDPPTGWGGPSVAVWTGRQMIGWGGGGGDLVLGDGAAYTPATNSWKLLPPAPLSPRHTSGVWTGKELIIAGGFAPTDRGERFFADAAAYNPATETWRKLSPMPVARDAPAIWDGSEVLLVGGVAKAAGPRERVPARGLGYDPSTDRWRWLAPMTYARGWGSVTTWVSDQLIVWGGVEPDGSVPPHGEAYDPVTDTWSALPKAPMRARVGAVAAWTGRELIIWGGSDARTWDGLRDGAAFTPASG